MSDREKQLLAIIWGLLNSSNHTIDTNTAIKYMEKIEEKVNTLDIWHKASESRGGTIIGLLEMI